MDIHESCLELISVDSRFQRNSNRTPGQRIGNAHETSFCSTNTPAVVLHRKQSNQMALLWPS